MVISIKLKRGYAVDVEVDQEIDNDNIVELGNYSKSDYNSTQIVSIGGISPTIRENHGQVVAILSL